MHKHRILTLRPMWALILTAGLTSFQAAVAQEVDEDQQDAGPFSDWTCRLCPATQVGWSGMVDFGIGYVTDDSLRYGNYRGLEDKGAYAPLDADAHYKDSNGHRVEAIGRDLAIDSRELEVKGGREGVYELSLSWNQIPTYRGYGAQTDFLGQGSDTLTLPADWVAAPATSEMSALQASLQPAPMKLQRKILDAGATFRFSRSWSMDVDAQRQNKSGTRPFGGAGVFYNNATQILAPVDFTTDRLDVGLNWSAHAFQLRLGFMGSWFDNDRTSLTWDNPFSPAPGVEQFRSALEPSNEFYQFSLSGAWTIMPGLHLSGSAAVGEMTQDETFLPYSINPEFDGLALPRTQLDGTVKTGVYNLGGKFVARLSRRLSFTATAKYDERDNQTPVDVYTPVNSDLFLLGDRQNRPYGFERTRYSADVRFRAMRKLRLGGGVRYKELERTLQAIEESDETTWWAEAKFTPFSRTHLRLSYEQGERDTSEYEPVSDSGRLDHPLFRKYNQADRDRHRGQLEAFYSTMGGFGINLTIFTAEDEYEESVLGLQSSEVSGATFGLDYAIGLSTSIYGFVSREDIESKLFGQDNEQTWVGDTDDQIITAGAGLNYAFQSDKQLGIDLVYADTVGEIDVRTGSEAPFPDLRTTLRNVRVHFTHDVSDKWGYRLYVEFESFDSSDWAIDGLAVDGLDPVLTYGLISPNYDVVNLRAQATYRF